ncbi:MAG: PAS domain S-box protein [Candidatus Pacebacteria bacterium]|nr:PAS domain S-box protein [Candidatus Paceibacterota bacterium]
MNEAKNNQRIRRNYESNKDEKYGANCKAAIILISGNKSNIGEVLNANNELAETLGYDKRDIIGANISKIMPSAIGQKHHELIKEYFHKRGSSKQSSNYDNEKIVFALHKLGHIVPCTLFHKLVPNLVKGIQLIGFIFLADDLAVIRPGEEKVKHEFLAIVLTDTTWAIHGFNSKFARLFHLDLTTVDIRRYLNAEEKLNIGKLVPEIEDNDNLAKMKSDEGFVLDIDVERISKEIEAEIDALHPPGADEEEKKSEGSSSDRSVIRDFRMYGCRDDDPRIGRTRYRRRRDTN